MSMSVAIRRAELEDAVQIVSLTHELGYFTENAETIEWLGILLKSASHAVFVASSAGNDLSGWLVVEKRISLETGYKAEISGLVVKKDFQRRGIGRGLVEAAMEWSRQNNLYKLVVRSNIQRTAAHIFYPRMGFSMCKTAHNYELNLKSTQ